jgi:hypothetical protein
MSTVLNSDQRRHLDGAVQRARTAAEQAATDALRALAVAEPSRPGYLSDTDNSLRLALREKARQLGDNTASSGADLTNLMREVAYEQWHRLLFARFLEVNGLLRHPEFRDTSLTLDDCSDLADDLDEPDGWSVAARFAAEILPGVFRLDDPAVQVRFATEHRVELERILLSIPSEVFKTEDALGWVYQFWQTAEKKRVNESGVKIGGADLSPVTQLFTENYMVRFLLENSLGAWWAARHPNSPLIDGWTYLRRLDDGTPAAGTFDEWPATAAEITVMDPCCGSGHFLVAMFGMLWRMRAEEEGLSPADAQDAVVRDNLHGLELDPRCTQIATFNVALEAWKQGGFRELPAPQVACSGVPVRAARAEWEALAGGDTELIKVMGRMHSLFRNADTLGSLIDPGPVGTDEGLFGRDLSIGADWARVGDLLRTALGAEHSAGAVLGHAAVDVVHAAELLARRYTFVATNPPWLKRGFQDATIRQYLESAPELDTPNLATSFVLRMATLTACGGSCAAVIPQGSMQLTGYVAFRKTLLQEWVLPLIANLGPGAFSEITGEIVKATLLVAAPHHAMAEASIFGIDASRDKEFEAKAHTLRNGMLSVEDQTHVLASKESRLLATSGAVTTMLGDFARSLKGTTTGDDPRFRRYFWEARFLTNWTLFQASSDGNANWSGLSEVFNLVELDRNPQRGTRRQAVAPEGTRSVAINQARGLTAMLSRERLNDLNAGLLIPTDASDLPAIYAYCRSEEYRRAVRAIDGEIKVTNATLVKVPFDRDHWRRVADEQYPDGLPAPHSDDPAQWLFCGGVVGSVEPLQVAVARLLNYRWPDQRPDDLDQFADSDGIAALQSLPGEPDLATRLRELLAAAYGNEWSSVLERTLVTEAGGKNGRLEDWLRDTFFTQHVKAFNSRPFLWHIWDGRKDGFSAIVNYHRLDHKTLEKLTFTSLGAWLERQRHEAAAGRPGADVRLAAAETLQKKLELILDGAPPYDVYVRWKGLHEQPIGWNPDLDDGVRLNIRPFVTAGVLRSKVNVHWKKDRGTNADGSERHNDLHPTLEERREARRLAGGQA